MNNYDGKQFITLTDDDLVQISGGGADWLWNGVGYVVGKTFKPLKPAPPGYRETLFLI
ncbi:MAG: hypothetical protein ACTIDI_04280 [Pseudolactococcus laudensis]